jgi:hypothetical protein
MPKVGGKRAVAVTEMKVTLPDGNSDQMIRTLTEILSLPKSRFFAGCAPCRSGLDRIIIEDPGLRFRGRSGGAF